MNPGKAILWAQMRAHRAKKVRPDEPVAVLAADTADMVVSALAVEVGDPGEAGDQWVQLLPIGVFGGQRDARGPWVIDGPEHAEKIVQASRAYAGNQDPVVDYDHQSEAALDPAKRKKAVASGWIKELQARPDGVYGRIDWTAPARAHLKSKEYRYISPVFGHEKPRGQGQPMRVTRLFRAGLTNNPCLPELAAVASQHKTPGANMDMSAIARALGLPETASCEEIVAAIGTMNSSSGRVAAACGLKADAKVEEVIAALSVLKKEKPDPTKFVPVEQVAALSIELRQMQADRLEEKAVAAVDKAVAGGKLVPALRQWGLDLFKKDPAAFGTWEKDAPIVIASGRTPKKEGGEIIATEEELAVAAAMGVSKEEYLESKKELGR